MAHCPCCKKTSIRRRQNTVSGIGDLEIVVHDFTCLECGAFENAEAGDATLAPMYARWRAHCAPAPAAIAPTPEIARIAAAARVVDAGAGEAARRAALATMRELATLLLTLDRGLDAAA